VQRLRFETLGHGGRLTTRPGATPARLCARAHAGCVRATTVPHLAAAHDDGVFTTARRGGFAMNEGMRWLMHQMLWEQDLDRFRAEDEAEKARVTVLPIAEPPVRIFAPTASSVVSGDRPEAA
jgi:hypothetical protein